MCAKIVSPVWSSARGSIAGTTYLTTPSGQIIARQRTRPTQPVSAFRTAVRNAFTEAVDDWTRITPAQQQQWQLWASAHTGRKGRQEMIAGKSLLRYMAELPLAPAPVIVGNDFAPEFTTTPAFSITTGPPAAVGTGVSVKIFNTGTIDCFYLIEISTQFGAQRNFWKGPWNPAQSTGISVAATANGQVDILGGVAGNYVFLRVRGVTNQNIAGTRGHVVTSSHIVRQIIATH